MQQEHYSEMPLRTRLLKLGELEAYIHSNEYWESPVWPISPHRAQAHLANPHGRPDDLSLILVYAGDELLAYLGGMADQVYLNGKKERMCWLSCMWVSPKLRGKGVAKQMMTTALDIWKDRVMIANYVPQSRGIYDSTGRYRDLAQMEGVRGYLYPKLANLLAPRGGYWRKLTPLWRLLDWIGSPLFNIRIAWLPKGLIPQHMALNELDDLCAQFIEQNNQNELCQRDADSINWMLQHRWVLSAPVENPVYKRYYFSSVAERFEYFILKLTAENQGIGGLMVLSYRDGHLKMPYCYYANQEQLQQLAKLFYSYALRLKAEYVSVFHQEMAAVIRDDASVPFLFKRKIERPYLVAKALDPGPRPFLQDGDGDQGFT